MSRGSTPTGSTASATSMVMASTTFSSRRARAGGSRAAAGASGRTCSMRPSASIRSGSPTWMAIRAATSSLRAQTGNCDLERRPRRMAIAWELGVPLSEVALGRFAGPPDAVPGRTRQATHAFRRAPNGQWYLTPLSSPAWQPVWIASSFPLSALHFGDFTGDGITDVLAIVGVAGGSPRAPPGLGER